MSFSGRYQEMPMRRCGASGVLLPTVTLGLWQNFGIDRPYAEAAELVWRAFDLGIFHFDLANNYGPPYGHAEEVFGEILANGLHQHRDELLISTKAGYDMWEGPFGDGGSRKYLIASLDQSLRRMGLDYVDIFYSHRVDPATPLEETMGALASAVSAGKALYVGVSSYSAAMTKEASTILRRLGVPLLIHQPSYSLFNRWIEDDLLDVLANERVGCIAFSVLAQGLATGKYLAGVPDGSRAAQAGSFDQAWLEEDVIKRVRALGEIASGRGQTLAQMAISWVLRDRRVTSALVGASSIAQMEENVAAAGATDFAENELNAIDEHAVDLGIDLWEASRMARPVFDL
jgi:L-glyceraldehyde 3-phosphate reductase